MTETLNNTPAYLAAGLKAGKELATMSRSGDKGEALAVVALVAAMADGLEMSYVVVRSKDDTDAPVTFTLGTYRNNIVSENGKNDSKAISARKVSLYRTLFGLDPFTAAQDQVIQRALVSAEYLHAAGITPTLNSKGQLVLPFGMIVPAPAADASDNAKSSYEALKGTNVSLDGRKGTSLRELRNRAVAAQPRKTRKAKAANAQDTAQDFRTALKFLTAVVEMVNNSDESPIAFKDEDLQALNMLAAGITALNGDEGFHMGKVNAA